MVAATNRKVDKKSSKKEKVIKRVKPTSTTEDSELDNIGSDLDSLDSEIGTNVLELVPEKKQKRQRNSAKKSESRKRQERGCKDDRAKAADVIIKLYKDYLRKGKIIRVSLLGAESEEVYGYKSFNARGESCTPIFEFRPDNDKLKDKIKVNLNVRKLAETSNEEGEIETTVEITPPPKKVKEKDENGKTKISILPQDPTIDTHTTVSVEESVAFILSKLPT